MLVKIRNMGPVRKADMRLTQLTVLTGPNNTGKSIVATILYGLFGENSEIVTFLSTRYSRSSARESDEEFVAIEEWATELLESGVHREVTGELRVYLEAALQEAISSFADIISGQLERAFGTPLQNLRRKGKRVTPGRIDFESSTPFWGVRLRVLGDGVQKDFIFPDFDEIWSRARLDDWDNSFQMQRYGPVRYLIIRLLAVLFSDYPNTARYLPAARSGMMQAQRVLASALLRQASHAGLNEMRVPSLSGVVSDFLSSMIEINDIRATPNYTEWADSLERDLMHGTIQVEPTESGQQEIYFSNPLGRFPLTQTSSMISELAPVVLILRYLLEEFDMLIMEEPEAHLHPAGQVEIARALLELSQQHLRVIVTTHSEFFLQRINNSISAAGIDDEQINRAGLARASIISPDLVTAYYFRPTDNGVVVDLLSIDESDGIQEQSFSDVAGNLYEQTVLLDQAYAPDAS